MRAGFIIVVLGGASAAAEEGCLKSIEISRNGEGFEMVDTKLLESRRSPSVFYQNENIVVVGGCRRRGEHLNSLEMFRIGGKSTLVPEVIKDGLSCSAFCQVQNGIGYVFGGFNKTGCHNLVYKINNGLVSRCPPLSTDLKNAAAVIARNNRAYIIGGWDGKRTLDTIFTYEDDKLLYETRLPYPVEGHSSSVFDEFIINVGGFDGVSVISTISIYDTITKRTLLVDAKLKTPRENHCTVIFKKDKKNVMLIMGGWDGQEALSECEAFELINESPFVIPIQWNCDLIEPRNRPAVVVVPTE